MKLSFIVPVYNVAPYLRKCVDSLLAQDIPSSEYEIILIDDGSPDACPQICDEYAATYENIRVIHQKNGGLSAARNSGIEAARGEYLCFVDSDDYWQPNVLSGLMAQVERDNLDVLRFDYQNVRLTPNGAYEVFEPNKTPRYIDHKNEIVDGETYLNTRMGYACYAVMFILHRDLIISTPDTLHHTLLKSDCLFTTGIHFEDVDWLPRMMLKAKRVNSTPTIVYNYLWREGSITLTQGNKDKIKKNVEDQMCIIEKYSAFIGDHPQCHWLRNMQSSMACGVLTTVAREFYLERKVYINRLREWNVFPLVIADQGKTYTHRAILINLFGPTIFCTIMNLRKKIL